MPYFTVLTLPWVLVPKKIIGSQGDVETGRSHPVQHYRTYT